MKAGFNQNSTMKWLITTISSTEGYDGKFKELIEHPDWDCNNVELSVMLNGIEFSNVEDVFKRLHDHHENLDKKIQDLEYELRLFRKIKDIVREEADLEQD